MEALQRREAAIFALLQQIAKYEWILIGGYAVNAYTLPRFSVDCDIVVKGETTLRPLIAVLERNGFKRQNGGQEAVPYGGKFFRYEKDIGDGMRVSMDILVGSVFDRQSGAIFPIDWVFANSAVRSLSGKTIADTVEVRIINPEALVVMKWVCARATDIRDVFMLIPLVKNRAWVRNQIQQRYDFTKRFMQIKDKITAAQFRDNLQGVFGFIDQQTFAKHQQRVLEMEKD